MDHENELYAERLRRQAQAAALAAGETQWTDQLSNDVRIKLRFVWEDITDHMAFRDDYQELVGFIKHATTESIAASLTPEIMSPPLAAPNEHLLSLVEVEHEALQALADAPLTSSSSSMRLHPLYGHKVETAPEEFRQRVNRIFAAHIVEFSLHQNSRLVEIDSHEMHDAVVEPMLYLLHSQPQFAAAETAYQKALKELRDRDAGDAITDAATALQEVLKALGCSGNALGDLISSAKRMGLLAGVDNPLADSIVKTANWIAAKRNQGEAHRGDADISMSDAWMVVHLVGALAIRLSESAEP